MVSVGIVSYKCLDDLNRCLNSLVSISELSLEIIVVDNNSGYDENALENRFPTVSFVWNKMNIGYAPAANQIASHSTGKHLLFLNPDAIIGAPSIQNMLNALNLSNEIGAVGPLSHGAGGWHNTQYFINETEREELRNKDYPYLVEWFDKKYSSKIKTVKLLIGFCFLIEKKLFDSLGGFDESLVLGLDDLDISLRLSQKSLRLVIALDSYVEHVGQKSFDVLDSNQKNELQEISQSNYSQKLIDTYSSLNKVPKSWDLWEVDWFEPTSVSEKPPLVFYTESNEASIEKFKNEFERVLCEEIEGLETFFLKSEVLDNQREVLFVSELNEMNLNKLKKAKSSGEKKPIKIRNNGELETDVILILPKGRNVCDLKCDGNWNMNLALEAEQEIVPNVESLESTEQEIRELKLDAEDIYLYRNVLKKMRLNGEIKASISFQNSLKQCVNSKNPYSNEGCDFYEVQREVHAAGYCIQNVEWTESLKSEKEKISFITVKPEFRSDLEKALSQSHSLTLNLKAVSTEYDLDKKVSIIILGFNKVEYTRKCVESLEEFCTQNYELILINNGSTDGTKDYFDSVPDAVVIHNDENLGVSAGWNQGLDIASGEYYLILNNDVIVPPNAVENLVRTSMNFPNAGIVAPRTNSIAGPQKIIDFKSNTKNEIVNELVQYQNANDLSAWEFHRIKGFCMLIPKHVMLDVGYFDERFGKGNFEDDDYSVRVWYSGYTGMVSDDSAFYHYGSVSFGQDDTDWNALMKTNHKKFEEKWNKGRSSMESPFLEKKDLKSTIESELKSISNDLKKSLSLTPKVEEPSLVSFNETPEVVETPTEPEVIYDEFYIQAEEMKEQGRVEEAFRLYCLSIEKEPTNSLYLKSTIDLLKSNYAQEEYDQVMEYLKLRFSTNSFWIEMNEPEPVVETEDFIEKLEKSLNDGKVDEAQAILNENQHNVEVEDLLNYQGLIQYYRQELDKAFNSFKRLVSLNPVHQDALFNLFDIGIKLGHQVVVKNLLITALDVDPELTEIRRLLEELEYHLNHNSSQNQLIAFREINIKAENRIREGLLDQAEVEVRRVLEIDAEQFRANNNLGLIHWYKGNVIEASDCFLKSVEKNPYYTDALLNLYDACVMQGATEGLLSLFENALVNSPKNKDLLEIKDLLEKNEIPERLQQYFSNADQFTGEMKKLNDAKQHIENKEYSEAVQLYLSVLEEDESNAEAYNGLGIVAYYWGQHQEAYNLFKQSLGFKLLDEDALLNFWDVAEMTNKRHEAVVLLQEALSLDPNMSRVESVINGVNNG